MAPNLIMNFFGFAYRAQELMGHLNLGCIAVAPGDEMALQVDSVTSPAGASSGAANGSVLKAKSAHSPSSNDSGFQSDQLTQQHLQDQRRPSSRNRNIKHKPTYVSVFASDPDYSSPLFDEFDRRFAAWYIYCSYYPISFITHS
ncbi:unnamed protein product [Gongylonema pulchrum]|uniref:Uncharacterized protein n=1 Tax=Gongylonema pulchrum TaxID=637853 RepID=A0A183EEG0_9BILA|nr:unnamed protein product [Gongylonema pulchrum]